MKTRRLRSKAGPPGSGPHRLAGFTLAELMIGVCMTAVLLTAAMGGVVAMQQSYSATESYGTGLTDQMRLLDSLAQDLRRAISPATGTEPWTLDPDGQGLKITVPDYYRFNFSDPQHRFPVANDPILDPTSGCAYYRSAAITSAGAGTATVPYQTIAYRYTNGVITRTDPWQAFVPDGKGGYQNPGPVTIATSMDAFPQIEADNSSGTTNGVLRYKITFHSTFQPLAVANDSNAITLHNVTFVRSKNLAR